jgi:hypothetical protein
MLGMSFSAKSASKTKITKHALIDICNQKPNQVQQRLIYQELNIR